jgi:hypothetical protein
LLEFRIIGRLTATESNRAVFELRTRDVSMSVADVTGHELLESGRLAEACEQFWRAAEGADAAGDAVGLAVAALGLGGLWLNEHPVDTRSRPRDVTPATSAGGRGAW